MESLQGLYQQQWHTPTQATAQEALRLYDNSKPIQPSDSLTQESTAMIQKM